MNVARIFKYAFAVVVMSAVALGLIFSVVYLYIPSQEKSVDRENPGVATTFAERLLSSARPVVVDPESNYRPLPPETGFFRVPDSLRPVVDFWKRMYTSLYSYQAVIHDSVDVNMVYAIVDLRREPGMRRGNFSSTREAAKSVLKRYKSHMKYLLNNRYSANKLSSERRHLHNLINARGGTRKFKGADERMRVQRGLREVYSDSIIRSGKYLEHYRKIFRDKGLPEELSLLPHLESSYQFNALSSAGAVGIWQLTRDASYTIIHVTKSVDERIDPWRSAEAAARILRDNYNRLKSWPLAITAYNQGLNAMRRAVKQLGTKSIDTVIRKYRGRSFGFAGRNFYCAFVATIEVVHDFENHFGYLQFERPLPLNQHKIKKSAPLKTIAQELGIPQTDLVEANPHLRSSGRNSTSWLPKGSVLNLPPEYVEDGQ